MGTRLYPVTEDKELLEDLALVPRGTYALMEGIKKQIAARTTTDFLSRYQPPEGEYILGDVVHEACEFCPEAREIMVEMPDGEIMEGETCNQGENPDDASYLVHKWKVENYHHVHVLETFLTFGWGRVRFPFSWEDRLIRWNEEFIGPTQHGSYCCGGVEDLTLMEQLLAYNNIPISKEETQELDGLCWT